MSLKTEHATEQNRMHEKWMRHLSAVLIPKIMHVFAFGILIFLLVQSHGVRQSSAAPKDTTQKTKIEMKRDILYLKLNNNKIHQIIKHIKKSRERDGERTTHSRTLPHHTVCGAHKFKWKQIFLWDSKWSVASWMKQSDGIFERSSRLELICMLILVILNSDKPLICVHAFVSPISFYTLILMPVNATSNTKSKRIEWSRSAHTVKLTTKIWFFFPQRLTIGETETYTTSTSNYISRWCG